MSIWDRVQRWYADDSARYVVHALPAERVTPPYQAIPAQADRCYLRVWLVEMFLGKSRDWFQDWQPAVTSVVKLRFADREIELARLAAPSRERFGTGKAIVSNYVMVDLVPFRGGLVEIEAALLAMRGKDHLSAAISVIADFAALVAPPLRGALDVAAKVKDSVGKLFDQDGDVHLGFHNTLGGSGGANPLAPGYVAVILARADQLDRDKLAVRGDQLCIERGNELVPLTGHDHLLLRIELATTRDDLHNFSDIAELRDDAIQAFLGGDTARGEAQLQAAVARAATHPDLINGDRRALATALRDEVQSYRPTAHGATPETPPSWRDFVDVLPRGRDQSPLTFDELTG
jgi:hypothetical protein